MLTRINIDIYNNRELEIYYKDSDNFIHVDDYKIDTEKFFNIIYHALQQQKNYKKEGDK